MDVKLSSTKSIRIPAELWRMIFRFATLVPGSLDITGTDVFEPLPDMEREIAMAISQHTKNALAVVSKAWRDFAIEFVWEHIKLRGIIEIAHMSSVLKKSKKRDGQDSSYGRYTRRIDLKILELDSDDQLTQYADEVIKLLKCCPNLRIYTDQGTWRVPEVKHPTPRSIVHALGDLCGASLRRLVWDGGHGPEPTDLLYILNHCPRLTSLRLRFWLGKPDFPIPILPMRLPNLYSLELNISKSWLLSDYPKWELPALKHLVTTDSPLYGDDGPFKGVLKAHGEKLTSLAFTPCPWDENTDVPRLIRDCPNLTDLAFNTTLALPLNSFHPHIARVGLFNTRWGAQPESFGPSMSQINNHLRDLEKHFAALVIQTTLPSLERVRLVGFNVTDATLWSRSRLDWWQEWIDKWEARGVRFEAGNTELVSALFKKVVHVEVEVPTGGWGYSLERYGFGDLGLGSSSKFPGFP